MDQDVFRLHSFSIISFAIPSGSVKVHKLSCLVDTVVWIGKVWRGFEIRCVIVEMNYRSWPAL